MNAEISAQWCKHQLHIAGKDGLIGFSDHLPAKSDSIIHLEINGWDCQFELFSLEFYSLVKEPNEREVVQAQE